MNTQFHRAVAGSLCFALLAGSTLLVGTGPLNPPAGAVTGTAKPLGEVEPRTAINAVNTPGDADSLYTITQPGSYYLTGNVTGESGKHGIKISANGVTVDLNGFEMSGVPGMGAFDGVTLSLPGAANVTVLNGSLRGWGDCGIELGSANNVLVRDVQTNGNAGTGILVFSGSTVTGCGARNNGGGRHQHPVQRFGAAVHRLWQRWRRLPPGLGVNGSELQRGVQRRPRLLRRHVVQSAGMFEFSQHPRRVQRLARLHSHRVLGAQQPRQRRDADQ